MRAHVGDGSVADGHSFAGGVDRLPCLSGQFAGWSWLLGRHPALVVAPFTLLVPITGLLSGYLVLGEVIMLIEVSVRCW